MRPRPPYRGLWKFLETVSPETWEDRQEAAAEELSRRGVTFSIDSKNEQRVFPFDILPRILSASEWDQIEKGLIQRVTALNCFLRDIYNKARVLHEGVVPPELVLGSSQFRREMVGAPVAQGIHVAIAGCDLLRLRSGFVVLEDNLRVPSGASYMLANRRVLGRIFPSLFRAAPVASIEAYSTLLRDALYALRPEAARDDLAILLTPGSHNPAYFEHSFLAQEMGVPLAEGRDLAVVDGKVQLRTSSGWKGVGTIYRRVNDDFLDPVTFRPESFLGVPGLMAACRSGRLTVVNAIGTGVADDKAIYPFVPSLIRYYLGEEPILSSVETFLCERPAERDHVLANLRNLVVKEVSQAGGYGMLFGPTSSAPERAAFREKILAQPRNYIAQPVLSFSEVPCWIDGRLQPRRIDLRPFVLLGPAPAVIPGGLTRVALREGSFIVNSCQGGGSKDTWVLRADAREETLRASVEP
ncbi:circularly permuted type 2 ATP-grasp protein [Methylacidimicrobium cyclopophantes]|nr:circularly permuted type 2 ATP-grasp protein [Methylacidimicrobium cyclopophantes]